MLVQTLVKPSAPLRPKDLRRRLRNRLLIRSLWLGRMRGVVALWLCLCCVSGTPTPSFPSFYHTTEAMYAELAGLADRCGALKLTNIGQDPTLLVATLGARVAA